MIILFLIITTTLFQFLYISAYINIIIFRGCERSSFPCELSTYGCCPDGETAALGKNGTGCGENCLTTKFGCCPDGKTTAKGVENEGEFDPVHSRKLILHN